jgi:hypothetical protein
MTATATTTETMGDRVNARVIKQFLLTARENAQHTAQILNERRQPLNEQIMALNVRFDEDNAELLDQLSAAEAETTKWDEQLRRLAVYHYEETGEKKLDADCSVRVTTKFQYDAGDAVAWAEKNAPVMIVKSVDKKAFESLPQIGDLEFVKTVETPTAVIAKEFTEL